MSEDPIRGIGGEELVIVCATGSAEGLGEGFQGSRRKPVIFANPVPLSLAEAWGQMHRGRGPVDDVVVDRDPGEKEAWHDQEELQNVRGAVFGSRGGHSHVGSVLDGGTGLVHAHSGGGTD